MAKFFIVHLSDLHIGSRVTQTLNRLIESIANNKILVKKKVFLCITGDLINQGNYEKYSNTALKFFRSLKEKTHNKGIEFSDIHIIPGNHDKINSATNKLFSIAQQTGIEFPSSGGKETTYLPTENEVFDLQEQAFSEYIKLANQLFEIFEIKNDKGKPK